MELIELNTWLQSSFFCKKLDFPFISFSVHFYISYLCCCFYYFFLFVMEGLDFWIFQLKYQIVYFSNWFLFLFMNLLFCAICFLLYWNFKFILSFVISFIDKQYWESVFIKCNLFPFQFINEFYATISEKMTKEHVEIHSSQLEIVGCVLQNIKDVIFIAEEITKKCCKPIKSGETRQHPLTNNLIVYFNQVLTITVNNYHYNLNTAWLFTSVIYTSLNRHAFTINFPKSISNLYISFGAKWF